MNTTQRHDSISKKWNSIEACCLYVAEKLNKGKYQEWKNADYINLSAQIRRSTKVHISENTLKRFFGKLKTPEDYLPQKATRDALAIYIGFENWEDFESSVVPVQNSTLEEESKKRITFLNKNWIAPIVGITVLLLLCFSYFYFIFEPSEKAELYYKESKAYSPHSAIFKLRSTDGTALKLNEYHIEFRGWRNPKVQWKDHTISYYYEMPGVYYPVLFHNNRAIDTATVTLLSKGWEVTAQMQNDTLRLYPILHADSPEINPPTVHINDLHNAGVDTLKSFFVNYAFVKPRKLSADNFSIEAFVEASKSRPGVRCSQVDLTIYAAKGSHYFSLTKPECITWSYFKFGENIKTGKNEDLAIFGHDLSKGGKIRMEVHKQVVTIWLDQKQIFKTRYKQPIGQFKGINFMFGGLGKVNNVVLKEL